MSDIIRMAEDLGKAIAASPQAAALQAAREALDKEPDTVKILRDYNTHARKIAELEDQQKPVEPDDKAKLQQLHDTLVASDVFKKFTGAQVEYIDLMRQVNEMIRRQMNPPGAPAGSAGPSRA